MFVTLVRFGNDATYTALPGKNGYCASLASPPCGAPAALARISLGIGDPPTTGLPQVVLPLAGVRHWSALNSTHGAMLSAPISVCPIQPRPKVWPLPNSSSWARIGIWIFEVGLWPVSPALGQSVAGLKLAALMK